MGLVKKITAGLTAKEVLKHKLLRHGMVYTLSGIINKAVPFFLLPIITAYILPAEYGILNNYTGLRQLLAVFLAFQAMQAFSVKYYQLNHHERSVYLSNITVLWAISILAVGLFLFFGQQWIEKYYFISFYWQMMAILHMGMMFFFGALMIIYRLEERPVKTAVYSVVKMVVEFSLAIYLVVFLQLNWEGRVWSMLISEIVFALLAIGLLAHKKYFRFQIRKKYLIELFLFGSPLIILAFSNSFKMFLDNGFVTSMHGTYANGLFGLSLRFAILMTVITSSITAALIPFIYKQLSNATHSIKLKLVRLFYLYFAGIMALVFILTLFAQKVIVAFFKPEWSAAVPYIFWVLLGWGIASMGGLVLQLILFKGKSGLTLPIVLVSNGLHVLLAYFFIRDYGISGAVYVFCITSFITFVAYWVISLRVCPMPWFEFQFLKRKKIDK